MMFVACVALAAALVAQEVDYKAETARYSLYRADTAAERLRAYLKSGLCPPPKAGEPALAFAGEAECRRAVELLAKDPKAARVLIDEVERRWVRWRRAPLKPGETPDRPDMPHVNGWHGKDVPTDYAAAVMIRTYLAFARAGASPDAAAKAKLLTAAMTYAQKTNGCLPTFWTGKLREEDSRADAMAFSLAVLEEAAEFFRPAQDPGVTWVRGTDLPMEGCGYADAFPYQRLPLRFQRKMPAVDVGLGRHSTGLSFRFRTESSAIRLKWTLLSACLAMPHMPSTGTSGLDVYARTGTGAWRFVRNLRPKGRVNEASFGWTPGDECWIYLPPYNGLVDFSAGFDEGKGPLPAPRHAGARKPVVMYGHSITQGGCSGRPGTIWPTLVGRWLDVEVVNLGFSGSGHMQPEWAQAVADIEASCYVIDTVDNVDMEMIRTRYEPFIRTLRARHPGVPVVCLENTVLVHPEVDRERNAAVRAIVAKFAAEGGAPVEIVRTAEMIPDDECTVDGAHLNDWGMMSVARGVAPRIRTLLAHRK